MNGYQHLAESTSSGRTATPQQQQQQQEQQQQQQQQQFHLSQQQYQQHSNYNSNYQNNNLYSSSPNTFHSAPINQSNGSGSPQDKYTFDPSQALQHTSSFAQQFQDFQSVAYERKNAIRKFSERLQWTTTLLVPMLTIVTFTPFWWSTFLILSLLGCITVFYRAASRNQRLSIVAFFILLFCNEVRSVVVIIYQFVKIIHLSNLEIATMVIAFFDAVIFGPFNLYVTYWLLKSIQLDVYFLSQPAE